MLIDAGVVVPVANAVAGLPGLRDNLIWGSALYIPCEGTLLVIAENLAEYHAAWVLIIKMCSNLKSAVANGIEWQYGNIEVDEVRIVAIDGVEGAIVEIGYELLRRRTGTITPPPLCVNLTVVPRAVAHRVILGVELLWVETFPPFALAIGLGELAIVINASL